LEVGFASGLLTGLPGWAAVLSAFRHDICPGHTTGVSIGTNIFSLLLTSPYGTLTQHSRGLWNWP